MTAVVVVDGEIAAAVLPTVLSTRPHVVMRLSRGGSGEIVGEGTVGGLVMVGVVDGGGLPSSMGRD